MSVPMMVKSRMLKRVVAAMSRVTYSYGTNTPLNLHVLQLADSAQPKRPTSTTDYTIAGSGKSLELLYEIYMDKGLDKGLKILNIHGGFEVGSHPQPHP